MLKQWFPWPEEYTPEALSAMTNVHDNEKLRVVVVVDDGDDDDFFRFCYTNLCLQIKFHRPTFNSLKICSGQELCMRKI